MPEETATWEQQIEAADAPAPDAETQAPPPEPDPPPTPAEPVAQSEEPVVPSSDDSPRPEEEQATEATPEKEQQAEDVLPDDPEEVKALPTPSARRWARQRDREARLVDDYLNPEVPASRVAERLSEKSPSRYNELVSDFFESHGEQYLKNRFGLSAEEIAAKLDAGPEASTTAQDSEDYDVMEDPLVPDSVKEQLREAQALKKEFGEVKSKVETFETKEQERERLALEGEAKKIGAEFYRSVTTVIADGIRDTGLEVSPDDPPLVAGLKKAAAHILASDTEPTFDDDEENAKVTKRVMEFMTRRERENVFREEDQVKVRMRQAFEAVKGREDVAAILDAIKELSEAKARKINERGRGAPRVPESPGAGTAIPHAQPTSWDEAIAGAGR